MDEQRWWPMGPLLLVRFENISQFLCSAPQVTLPELRFLATQHGVEVGSRGSKGETVALLDNHRCRACTDRLVLQFRALARERNLSQCERVHVIRISDCTFIGVDERGQWVASTALLRQYRFVGLPTHRGRLNGNSILVSVSLESLCHLALEPHQLECIADAHLIPCGSGAVELTFLNRMINHSCSRRCRSVFVFTLREQWNGDSALFSRTGDASNIGREPDGFPFMVTEQIKMDLIREWEARMHPSVHGLSPCAVCAQQFKHADLHEVDLNKVNLGLLRNPRLPAMVMPLTYNNAAFDGAILYPNALRDRQICTCGDVCHICLKSLEGGIMPENALANFQYYAYDELSVVVAAAFERTSLFNLMLVARACCTKISFLFNHKSSSSSNTQQGFIHGNVAVLPQDTVKLRDVIPPGRDEIHEALCALFLSSGGKATKQNAERLVPIMVNKGVVRTLANFLVEHNAWYRGQVIVNDENIDDLYVGMGERALPSAIGVAYLNSTETLVESGEYRPFYVDEYHPEDNNDDLVMEAVGYTAGDHTPANYRLMKVAVLAHCLDGGRFIRVRSESTLVNEQEPAFMTWAFPHLDPFGIGGFNNSNRTDGSKILFEHHLRNLLLQDNSRFAKDPNFTYVCWNILQRKELNTSLYFHISPRDQVALGQSLYEIAPALTDLMRNWQADPWAKAKTDLQKHAVSILTCLQGISHHVKGTTGYKQSCRNELRGLIREFSTPALFLTINPADLYNPLFATYGGVDVWEWQAMSLHDRAVFIATHLHVAARAFHETVTAFFNIVVRCKKGQNGFFSECVAYYGMVEAQGRGTLHIHLLLWLKDSPNPQALQDRMQADEQYKERMVCWLEETIQCEIPGQTQVVSESNAVHPILGEGELDSRMLDVPQIDAMSDHEFKLQFRRVVTVLVNMCNWHVHTETCWKHLRAGEPQDDSHCRMRIDGSTRSQTEVDPETLSILLRRLHPQINNYNETLMFLLQCNMDIKFISSGPGAKALVFYITDYIMKSNLSVHAGLDAIKYALSQIAQSNVDDKADGSLEKTLFVKSVNALMARQELSHQQVMSYLIGGGDHYKSHGFVSISWDHLNNAVKRMEDGHFGSDIEEDHVLVDREGIHSNDLVTDYQFRPMDSFFANMSFWEYAQCAEKISVGKENSRNERNRRYREEGTAVGGWPANPRGFFLPEHPQHASHMVHLRDQSRIVSFVGHRIPQRYSGVAPAIHNEWCRAMVILFKPW